MSSSKDYRKTTFKNRGLTGDELRRRREETNVEIRKQKREEALFKRRNLPQLALEDEETSESDSETDPSTASQHRSAFGSNEPLIQTLTTCSSGIYSTNLDEVLENVKAFRKILSKGKNPPIDEVIKCGVVPRFIELLSTPTNAELSNGADQKQIDLLQTIQFEACWALTNITYGTSEQTMEVVHKGAVPLLISLMASSAYQVRDQAIWTLGNIIGDGPNCRDMLLNMNFMNILLQFIQNELSHGSKIEIVRNSVWCLSNLCRGKPSPDWEKVRPCCELLVHLAHMDDEQVLIDTCWCIAYISDGTSDRVNAIINIGLVPRIVQLLSHTNGDIQSPALRAVGNVVTGNDEQTQVTIQAGIIPGLRQLLFSPRQSIQRETCWAISNIAAGLAEQVQALIDADVFPLVIQILSHSDYRSKKEACWAISNATGHRKSHPDQVRYLVVNGAIKALVEFLKFDEPKMLLVALDALNNILEVGESDSIHNESINNYALLIEEADGLRVISDLQQHRSQEVYIKCKTIVDRFFASEYDDIELESAIGGIEAPSGEDEFSFGSSAAGPRFNF